MDVKNASHCVTTSFMRSAGMCASGSDTLQLAYFCRGLETSWVITGKQAGLFTCARKRRLQGSQRPLHVIVLTARVADPRPRRTVDGTFVNRQNLPEIGLPYHHSWAFSCLGTPFRLGQVTQYRRRTHTQRCSTIAYHAVNSRASGNNFRVS